MTSFKSHLARGWLELSQSERDAAYNNRSAIAEAEELIVARRDQSHEVRTHFPCHLDLSYGKGPRECWDIFPGATPNAPCLVFIHGGYWQGGDRKDFHSCARGALEMGWSAALCGYPLAPEASLSAIVSSISRALSWFAENRSVYGAGGPLILAGWSAGAHLAAINAGHNAVSTVLCLSGIFELAPIRDTYLNAKLNLTDQEISSYSPMRLRPAAKPLVVAYGVDELPELQRQSREFFRMREAAGAPGSRLAIVQANHLTVLDELGRAESAILLAARAALALVNST